VVVTRLLARHAGYAGRSRLGCRERLARLDLHQGTPLSARWQRGSKAQAIGISRGGQTTKVHVITDVIGRPAVIHLTTGNASDIGTASALIAALPGRMKRLIADRGYDKDQFREELRAAGTTPVIPGRRTRKHPTRHDEARYKDRWRIEVAFCRLKDFRRIATRYDKLAANYASAVAIASIVAFWC
jgi:transposase